MNPSSERSETQASNAPATAGSGFSGFSGGDVITATRRVRDGEDSDEEWDDPSDDELKNDPSWSPAGRPSSPGRRGVLDLNYNLLYLLTASAVNIDMLCSIRCVT